jgi:hypothetical protein
MSRRIGTALNPHKIMAQTRFRKALGRGQENAAHGALLQKW